MIPRLPSVSLRAAIEVQLWRHGAAIPAAFAVVGACAAIHLLAIVPMRERLADARFAVSLARSPKAVSAALDREQARPTDIRAVLLTVPPPDRAIANMIQLANAEGIGLPQSEYREQLSADAAIIQVQITQPMRVSYPQLREYIESVLRETPNASLDQVAARRENVGQPQLEAKLHWTIWLAKQRITSPTPLKDSPTP